MYEAIITSLTEVFRDKPLLTVEDICAGLGCSATVVYNWLKRPNPAKRPPKIKLGQEVKFPRGAFVEWLAKDQC
jgi:predicted DNA-binding transcriptional regulator AlpA